MIKSGLMCEAKRGPENNVEPTALKLEMSARDLFIRLLEMPEMHLLSDKIMNLVDEASNRGIITDNDGQKCLEVYSQTIMHRKINDQ